MVLCTALGWSFQAAPSLAAGPAANLTVSLNPSAIVANGTSTSTATATVTDFTSVPVPGDTVMFSASDAGIHFGPVTDHGDGTYSTTLTGSTTAGSPTITATDASGLQPSGQAILMQTPTSTTSLLTVPSAPVTNQGVTLIATVTSSTSTSPPSGTVTFENGGTPINGCTNDPIQTPGQSATVTCQTLFSASTSPEQLTAVFTATPGSAVAGSSSAQDTLVVGHDSSSTTLQVPTGKIVVGASVRFSATVRPTQGGPANPTGSVAFLDGVVPIPSCLHQPLTGAGTATCTLSYTTVGDHSITALYSGDANFGGSGSSPLKSFSVSEAPPLVLGTIRSTMQWTFFFTPRYTSVLQLVVYSAPLGATVVIQCHGAGCPFAKRATLVTQQCAPKSATSCSKQRTRTINLQPRLRNHRLRLGTQFTVMIVEPRFVGKYYGFLVRRSRVPRVQIGCLAPGGSRPNVGC